MVRFGKSEKIMKIKKSGQPAGPCVSVSDAPAPRLWCGGGEVVGYATSQQIATCASDFLSALLIPYPY